MPVLDTIKNGLGRYWELLLKGPNKDIIAGYKRKANKALLHNSKNYSHKVNSADALANDEVANHLQPLLDKERKLRIAVEHETDGNKVKKINAARSILQDKINETLKDISHKQITSMNRFNKVYESRHKDIVSSTNRNIHKELAKALATRVGTGVVGTGIIGLGGKAIYNKYKE